MTGTDSTRVIDSICSQTYAEADALLAEAIASGRKLAIEVIADSSGKFCGNGLRFDSVVAAVDYGIELSCRWTLVREFRIVIADAK